MANKTSKKCCGTVDPPPDTGSSGCYSGPVSVSPAINTNAILVNRPAGSNNLGIGTTSFNVGVNHNLTSIQYNFPGWPSTATPALKIKMHLYFRSTAGALIPVPPSSGFPLIIDSSVTGTPSTFVCPTPLFVSSDAILTMALQDLAGVYYFPKGTFLGVSYCFKEVR